MRITACNQHLERAVQIARGAVRVDMATDESFQDVFVERLHLATRRDDRHGVPGGRTIGPADHGG